MSNVETREFFVKSSFDGLNLSTIEVVPKGAFDDKFKVKGIVQLVHGMQEHKGRYIDFMTFLAEKGYATIIHDNRGHGGSVKTVDDLGYFYEKTATAVVEDVLDVQKQVKVDFPDKKIVLFGHSMGSLIVRKFIKKHDDAIDGLIVCGAPGKNPAAKAGLLLVKFFTLIYGGHHVSKLIADIAFAGTNDKLPGDDPMRWLSANEDNIKKNRADPLCGFTFGLNGYQNLMQLIIDNFDKSGWQMLNSDMPILFVAGEDDPIIGGKENWDYSQEFLRERGYSTISGILYSGMRHEILNEKENETVYNDLLEFVSGILL